MSRLPNVVITSDFHPATIRAKLRDRARILWVRDRRALERHLPKADALLCAFYDPIDAKLLAKAPRLKAIGNFGVGVSNIDLRACKARDIAVCNTPDVVTRPTAELALTLLLAAAKRLPEAERLCREGDFSPWTPRLLNGLELEGRHAVLVGKGRIGKETEKLFRGIGLKTSWITRQDSAADIRRKLQKAQILSLHVPLTPQTRHWLNRARIARLPADAIVINTTRGPVVDERALAQALRTRKIFAAGLDVFENEPKIPKSLTRLPNVVLTPHIGTATDKARSEMARLAIDGVFQILIGKNPPNRVV